MAGRIGRPHKFTRETVDALLEGVRAGLPFHLAAEAAGISESTFHAWQSGMFPRGADKSLKAEFSEALTHARGFSALKHMELLNAHAITEWKAAAWILERRFPQEFGVKRVELTGKDGGPIELASKTRRLIEEVAIEWGIEGDQEEVMEAVQRFLSGDQDALDREDLS